MISIISIADGVLRDRAAAFKLEKGRLYVIGAHRSYDATLYTEVDADSSGFEIGGARWANGAWETYPVPISDPPNPDDGVAAQRARQLTALAAQDPEVAKIVDVLQTAGLV